MSEEEFAASFSLVTQVCLRREAEAHLEVDCFRFCPFCVIRDYAVEPPGRVGSGPSSELYRATRTASEDGWWLPGHPCDHGASLRVPSRWTTSVQARAR